MVLKVLFIMNFTMCIYPVTGYNIWVCTGFYVIDKIIDGGLKEIIIELEFQGSAFVKTGE